MGSRKKNVKTFAADLETTVYEGQTCTEAWSSALCELYTDEVMVHHSLTETYEYLRSIKQHCVLYYHNLKFDGEFWLHFLINKGFTFSHTRKLYAKQFDCMIGEMGQWYTLRFKLGAYDIELRDSIKLFPFSLAVAGEAFHTEHRKLEMKYEGYRYAGCDISKEEEEYIKNDVYVLKECLEFMYEEGNKSLTIGSCCIKEFKKTIDPFDYQVFYPDYKAIKIDKEIYGSEDSDEYCRKGYSGGWCYVKKGYEGKEIDGGQTYDVNSLYSSVQHSKSGNYYPVGNPHFFQGAIPDIAKANHHVYFVRFRCRFQLREGYLPTVQIKQNSYYRSTEYLETSDIYYRGKYYKEINIEGKRTLYKPTITMTSVSFALFQEHYEVSDLEILDGCWLYTEIGIYDKYINKYYEKKQNSVGAERTEAKLFLNNEYGKLASSDDSSYKIPEINPTTGGMSYRLQVEHNKKTMSIPQGAFTTAYARDFTIRHAQMNYELFIYSDTDSIHCHKGKTIGIEIHPSALLCWKHESDWDKGKFLHQKTYIEHITHKDGKKIKKPYYDIKACGMPDDCKDWYRDNHKGRELEDFKMGLETPGKKVPKHIEGGIILEETTFTITERIFNH